jgi:hypothetical protein
VQSPAKFAYGLNLTRMPLKQVMTGLILSAENPVKETRRD